MSNCQADVTAIISVSGTTVSTTYLDLRVSPPVVIDQTAYDALVKVRCPETVTDNEMTCLQTIGNTDASLIEQGFQCVTKSITYDVAGVATVAIDSVTLHQADGTDVTATHEMVACPEAIVTELSSCVA